MKKLSFALFALLFILAALFVFSQTGPARNLTKRLLLTAIQQSGLQVEIGEIQGALPRQLELQNVSITDPTFPQGKLTIETLKLRLSLLHLLKKELFLEKLQTSRAVLTIEETSYPFDLSGSFRINRKKGSWKGKIIQEGREWKTASRFKIHPDQRLTFSSFSLRSELFHLKGQMELNSQFKLEKANFQIGSDALPSPTKGRLLAHLTVLGEADQWNVRLRGKIPRLKIEEEVLTSVQGSLNGVWKEGELTGTTTLSGNYQKTPWELKTDLSWANKVLTTPNLTIQAPQIVGKGNLSLTSNWTLLGESTLTVENLNTLPVSDLFGKLEVRCLWSENQSRQAVQCDATFSNLFYGPFFAEKGTLYSDLILPDSGPISLDFEKVKWDDLTLENLNIETNLAAERAPFTLFLEGNWKHSLEIQAEGFWDNTTLQVDTLKGEWFNRILSLRKPLTISYTPNHFAIPEIDLSLSKATLTAHFDRQKDSATGHLTLQDWPLELLSLSNFDASLLGTLSLDGDFVETDGQLKGDFTATVTQFEGGEGTLEGHLAKERLDLKIETPSLQLESSLPLHISLWPFRAELYKNQAAQGHFQFNGPIEDLLDFIPFGPHRLEGTCHCDLELSHTLAHPYLTGSCQLQNGIYQNYYTGMELKNLSADLKADRTQVDLLKLAAVDSDEAGTLQATGSLKLDGDHSFPFVIGASFSDLHFAQIDLVTASADGTIHIEGDAQSALATGEVRIVQGLFTIPDHIPPTIPDLQVTYRNQTRPITPTLPTYTPYPLHLNLHLSAPEGVIVEGRGLHSEWKGDFQIGGTFTDMATKGKMELVTGEFQFASKEFHLTEGSLSLSGKEHEMPYLNLAGTMETKGIAITARLKGPLDSPQLTFQSVPPLAMSSIVSYLLFGQDVSEISGFQALELISSLSKVAGGGNDVIESTRRSLGVDRLRVVTNTNGNGEETLAIQVGKYVADGFLVSFTQGAEDSAPNISVEIELKNNFVFQIENMQQQEQGKFTLKWNHNY